MNLKSLFVFISKMLISILSAGFFYIAWLALFLTIIRLDIAFVNVFGWLIAPLATALGFALGVYLFETISKRQKNGFFELLIWPLIGCIVGALIVVWFGPMLIVFGMFALGTFSVLCREIVMSK